MSSDRSDLETLGAIHDAWVAAGLPICPHCDAAIRADETACVKCGYLRPDPEGGNMDLSTNRGGTALTARPRSTGDDGSVNDPQNNPNAVRFRLTRASLGFEPQMIDLPDLAALLALVEEHGKVIVFPPGLLTDDWNIQIYDSYIE